MENHVISATFGWTRSVVSEITFKITRNSSSRPNAGDDFSGSGRDIKDQPKIIVGFLLVEVGKILILSPDGKAFGALWNFINIKRRVDIGANASVTIRERLAVFESRAG